MKHRFKNFLSKYGSFVGLFALVVVLSILSPDFLTISNLMNVLNQVSLNGLVAIGMTFVILSAGIDLSVGSVLAFTGAILAAMLKGGIPGLLAMLICVILGAVLGGFNGYAISKFRLQPFIVTLASMIIFRGATLVFTNGIPITGLGNNSVFVNIGNGSFLGIPYSGLILILFLLFMAFILSKTIYGKAVYAIGGNTDAARLSGINVYTTRFGVYVFSGLFSSIAGIILVSRLDSAQPVAGQGYEMDAIAAVVLGGTSLSGGRGYMLGTLIGVLIIGILNNGLNLLDVSAFYQQIVKGAVILFAVMLDRKR